MLRLFAHLRCRMWYTIHEGYKGHQNAFNFFHLSQIPMGGGPALPFVGYDTSKKPWQIVARKTLAFWALAACGGAGTLAGCGLGILGYLLPKGDGGARPIGLLPSVVRVWEGVRSTMMADWAQDDANLLKWRAETNETAFEKQALTEEEITEQEYYDKCILMIAMVKAGVELAFETMVDAGIIEESAYYESLHETPLIANTIARKKLYEMNVVISDTAEYGCYLFSTQLGLRIEAPQ